MITAPKGSVVHQEIRKLAWHSSGKEVLDIACSSPEAGPKKPSILLINLRSIVIQLK